VLDLGQGIGFSRKLLGADARPLAAARWFNGETYL